MLSLTETQIPAWNNDGNVNQQTELREESSEPKADSKPKGESTGFKVTLTSSPCSYNKQDTHPSFAIKSSSSTGTLRALPSSSTSGLIPLFWHLTPAPVLELTLERPPCNQLSDGFSGTYLELNFRSSGVFSKPFSSHKSQKHPES